MEKNKEKLFWQTPIFVEQLSLADSDFMNKDSVERSIEQNCLFCYWFLNFSFFLVLLIHLKQVKDTLKVKVCDSIYKNTYKNMKKTPVFRIDMVQYNFVRSSKIIAEYFKYIYWIWNLG